MQKESCMHIETIAPDEAKEYDIKPVKTQAYFSS